MDRTFTEKKPKFVIIFWKNLLVMKVFLLDNCRSRSWSRSRSRKHNFFSAPAPAPAKKYGSGRLRLRLRLRNTDIYSSIHVCINLSTSYFYRKDSDLLFMLPICIGKIQSWRFSTGKKVRYAYLHVRAHQHSGRAAGGCHLHQVPIYLLKIKEKCTYIYWILLLDLHYIEIGIKADKG